MAKRKRSNSSRSRGKIVQKNLSQEELCSLVGKKAYELYAERGYTHGNDLGDWYRAEKIVKQSLK